MWPPECLHLTPVLPYHTDGSRQGWQNPPSNIPDSERLSHEAWPSQMLVLCQWASRGAKRVCFQFPLSESEPESTPNAPCLLSKAAPPESVLPADSSMLIEVGGNPVLPEKHKKQGQVPKCLTSKGGPVPWSQGMLESFGRDLGSEMPCTLLNSLCSAN